MRRAARYVYPLLLIALVGCNRERQVGAHLQALGSCADVEEHIRSSALEEMNRRIDQRLQSTLRQLGSCYSYGYEDGDGLQPTAAAGGSSNQTRTDPSDGPDEVSGTNNQVAGVDEADFIKTDGNYIYLATDATFRIFKSWPAPETAELSRVAVEGVARKIFVQDGRALVYSSLPLGSGDGSEVGADSNSFVQTASSYQECTYGYSCRFTGDGHPTKITVLDIRDPSQPVVVRELRFSGSLLAARRIGRGVHTVLTSPGVRFAGLRYSVRINTCSATPWAVVAAFEVLREENARIIRDTPLEGIMPSYEDVVHVNGERIVRRGLATDCAGVYAATLNDGSAFTSVASLDLQSEAALSLSTIVSRPGAVYASEAALYMSVPHERGMGGGWYRGMDGAREASTVHKFSLDSSPVRSRYEASGVVKGKVLGQFSLDEHEDHLRIATTTGRVPNPEVYSTLTVLRQEGSDLQPVGSVDELAPKEDIRSVRFVGSRGYVVTFKKTDPLFVFDLSQPRSPRVMAELKIPGFSTYMHPMDETHLLTIGYDADDRGTFAYFTGVLLQIFDVSDPTDPKLVHREVIGTRGSSSEALTNHLAFTYMESKRLLALPMTICDDSNGGGSYGSLMTFSGLLVYDVGADTGFAERGRVDHGGEGASCHNWWTNATSVVRRSIIMDDYVFSISRAALKVNALGDLATDLVSLPLAD